MTSNEKKALDDVIEAVSRINVALQGRFMGGEQEFFEIQKLLTQAIDTLWKPAEEECRGGHTDTQDSATGLYCPRCRSDKIGITMAGCFKCQICGLKFLIQ